MRYDLEQALLRLPRDVDPVIAKRASGLGSAAGRWMADWLYSGGLPHPTIVHIEPRTAVRTAKEEYLVVTSVTPAGAAVAPPKSFGHPFEAAHRWTRIPNSFVPLLVDLPTPPVRRINFEIRPLWPSCWPMTLPGYPDVIAAHLTRYLVQDLPGLLTMLPSLAEAQGPIGPGMSLTLANGLGANDAAGRAATADACLMLAAHGRLDGEALGANLGLLISLGLAPPIRVVPTLRDILTSGAHHQVWNAMARLLAVLMENAKLPNRFADQLVLGFDAAEASGARGEIPAVATTAASTRRSRMVTEARRLHSFLTRS